MVDLKKHSVATCRIQSVVFGLSREEKYPEVVVEHHPGYRDEPRQVFTCRQANTKRATVSRAIRFAREQFHSPPPTGKVKMLKGGAHRWVRVSASLPLEFRKSFARFGKDFL